MGFPQFIFIAHMKIKLKKHVSSETCFLIFKIFFRLLHEMLSVREEQDDISNCCMVCKTLQHEGCSQFREGFLLRFE